MGGTSQGDPTRRVLIVTGHHTLRVSLKDLINLESDLTVGGEAENLTEARRLSGDDHMVLAIVDHLAFTDREPLRKPVFPENPHMPVILMTLDNELDQLKRALAAGVRGCVTKQDLAEELIPAVRNVLNGQRYISRELLVGIPARVRAAILDGETTEWNE